MVNYLEVLSKWMEQPQYLLLILAMVYFVSATLDFLFGSFNAAHSPNIVFSSRTAQMGIVRKLGTLGVMILVVPFALILPLDVGIYSLTILYLGIAGSEIYSILAHIGIVKDGDKHKNLVGTLFTNLLESVFNTKDINKKD
jgi:toxin secretion/phage lysis holin